MQLTDVMRAAIRKTAHESQAKAREANADDPETLAQLDAIEDMLYDLTLRQYELGHHNRMLAVAFHEALVAVQEQINKNVPVTAETMLVVENPYDV